MHTEPARAGIDGGDDGGRVEDGRRWIRHGERAAGRWGLGERDRRGVERRGRDGVHTIDVGRPLRRA